MTEDDDRRLVARCIAQELGAWTEFVDQYGPRIHAVIKHTATARAFRLGPDDLVDIADEVGRKLLEDDCARLRHFEGEITFRTWLTVVARRVAVHEIAARQGPSLTASQPPLAGPPTVPAAPPPANTNAAKTDDTAT